MPGYIKKKLQETTTYSQGEFKIAHILQEIYKLRWHPGQENLADYQSKHHVGAHHVAVRPWYLHTENSLRYFPRAERPSTLKGCVGTLKDGYIRNIPLPRVTQVQSTTLCMTRMNPLHIGDLPIPWIPLWSDFITKSPSGLSAPNNATSPFCLLRFSRSLNI